MSRRGRVALLVAGLSLLPLTGCTSAVESSKESEAPLVSNAQQESPLADCLQEAGWDATPNPDGSVVVDHPIEQTSAYEAAANACLADLDTQTSPDSEATLRPYYKSLEESAACLTGLGYEVAAAPTYESWAETAPEDRWTPYLSLPEDSLLSALEACPQP